MVNSRPGLSLKEDWNLISDLMGPYEKYGKRFQSMVRLS
jgi:hypothetical protein